MEKKQEKKFLEKVKDAVWRKPKAKIKAGCEWLKDNQNGAVAVSIALLGFAGTVLNVAVAKDQLQLKLMDRKVWVDPETNQAWELKRQPTNDERQMIYSALRNKEDVVEVLRSLQLI